jgi:hypothetical protein
MSARLGLACPAVTGVLVGVTMLAALIGPDPAWAQAGPRPARPVRPDRVAASREDVMKAAREVKASLDRLLALDEQELNAVAAQTEQWRQAYEAGRATTEEVAASEAELADVQARVVSTKWMLLQNDHLLAEAAFADRLEGLPALRKGGLQITAAFVRYHGARAWSLAGLPRIERFFQDRFTRPLPISALGQTPAHDRLGLDHRDAVDVAVHPDSTEGHALMAHLQSEGITFIAIREAIAGASTGAHIHIGPPSQRFANEVGASRRR